jgi:hypothetical protein
MKRRAFLGAVATTTLVIATAVYADKSGKPDGTPPGLAKKGGMPPGLAKQGGMPPGLAKKFGGAVPTHAFIAFDPKHDDRAWFLIDGRWVLRQGFDPGVRTEVRLAMQFPASPPPVPLPAAALSLHVVMFH